jgi:hypothetical protein
MTINCQVLPATVKKRLTVAGSFDSGDRRSVPRLRSGGFDTGAAAVRLPAIGRPSQVARISPMEPPRGVPVSNPPRLGDFLGFLRPRACAFRASRPAPEASRAGATAGARVSRPSRRRERPLGAALNPYRKFSQRRFVT